ncbi:MAG: transglutaminase-like domain-containing protein, partial [Planctomycetota bacterium]
SPTASRDETIVLGPEVRLLGQVASQRLLCAEAVTLGQRATFHNLGLISGQLVVLALEAELVEILADDLLRYRVTIDRLPGMPMEMVINRNGDLERMTMTMGPLSMAFERGSGPQVLSGVEMAMVGMIEAVGPSPSPDGANRYRLPPALVDHLIEDGFQRRCGTDLIVMSAAQPEPLLDDQRYLSAEPQLELDDPELRSWVAEQLYDVPRGQWPTTLTRAVRSYLTGDLGRGEASALEAFRSRRGDCTEHANLLVAALRIAGIPARVEVGVVYVGQLGGWGGHAWTAAYDREAGRWQHLDAAYPGVPRSCYIKTGEGGTAAGTDALLDHGLGLLLGQRIEVLTDSDLLRR